MDWTWLAGLAAVALLFGAIVFFVKRPGWRKPDASLPPNDPWTNYRPPTPRPPARPRPDPREPIP